MQRRTATLSPGGLARTEPWADLQWHLTGDGLEPFTLFHGVHAEHAAWLPPADRGDHAVLAALMWAMRERRDLHVHGDVSPALLAHLQTFQEIWHRWKPTIYHHIEITADREAAAPSAATADGVFAFSGGVDASFTLFRHLAGHPRRHTRRPGAALIVHGLDIPIARAEWFDEAAVRAERMLRGTSVPLVRLRTNARHLAASWPDANGIHVLACLVCFQSHFGHGVKAADEPYDALVLPWGSTPMTDVLGSTEAMRVEHDGAAYDRSDKVDWLASHTTVADHLRVCWAGPHLGRNCGACEKCLRTMLNFWATGHEVPAAFPTRLRPSAILAIETRNAIQIGELRGILRHAEQRRPAEDPLLRALSLRVRHPRIAHAASRLAPALDRIVSKRRQQTGPASVGAA